MPPLSPTTRNVMIVCAVAFLLSMFAPLMRWLALWPLGSGLFMPWQLLSYTLLHGDLAHLLFNMLGLWMFGSELERLWGVRRYLQFMAGAGVAAAVTQLLVTALMGSAAPTVGASGVLFGLLMAYALSFPRRQFDLVGFLPVVLLLMPSQILNIAGMVLFFVLFTNRQAVPIPPVFVPAMTLVAIYGALELFLGLFVRSGGIAHFAHLGGLLGGWLMMAWWRNRFRADARRGRR
ncbi:MAG: rhomboid family intramembrane serine protease [Rubrivivax sp.]|jgi:membrane associated rhomboid family serine protease|nr:rhomboid family intramembrane serine protease [Rubrivivax sp.]